MFMLEVDSHFVPRIKQKRSHITGIGATGSLESPEDTITQPPTQRSGNKFKNGQLHSFRITDSKTTNNAQNENKPSKAIIEDD